MPSSLFTAVSGLISHQRKLDTVANNIANVNTAGFKSQRIVFADLMYDMLAPGTSGSPTTIGGTNPIELGSGVRVAQLSRQFNQGSFESTGQLLDFALQGNGFFTLHNGMQYLYSRSGAFSLDESGYLIDPATGYHVQRFGSIGEPSTSTPAFQTAGDNRIHIPLGQTVLGQETQNLSFDGILSSEADKPLVETLTSAIPFEAGGSPATTATLLDSLDSNVTGYQAGDTIDINGTHADGTSFSTSLAADGTTTVGDLINQINSVLTDATASLDASGNVVLTANNSGDAFLSLTLTDAAGNTGSTDFQSHSMVVTVDGKAGDTFSGTTEIFDVRGGSRDLQFTFQKTDDRTWDLTFSLDPGDGVVQTGTISGIQFNDAGNLVSPSSFPVDIQFSNILQPQTVTVDIQSMLHIASPFALQTDQDGLEPSQLASVNVNSDGTLVGISSTGRTFDLAQIAVTLFRNPQGLSAVGTSYFEEALNSGSANVGTAASGGRGAVRGGQLEGSNVDIAYEFTQLIVAQRGFSANARTVSVADEVLEELTNIIR